MEICNCKNDNISINCSYGNFLGTHMGSMLTVKDYASVSLFMSAWINATVSDVSICAAASYMIVISHENQLIWNIYSGYNIRKKMKQLSFVVIDSQELCPIFRNFGICCNPCSSSHASLFSSCHFQTL